MATLGGNLCVDTRCTYYNQTEEWRRSIDYCMKEEGTVCWVAPGSSRCWAHTASDAAPVLCALGAEVRLVSTEGRRTLPVEALYRDDGIDYLAKRPQEILTEILLPASAAAAAGCRASFWKLRRRGTIDFAVLSVAAAIWSRPDGAVTRRADLPRRRRLTAAAGAGRGGGAGRPAAWRRVDRRGRGGGAQGRHAARQHRLPGPLARRHDRPLHRGRPARDRRPADVGDWMVARQRLASRSA